MTSPTAPPPEPNPNRWWWIAGGAVAAVVLIVVLVLVLTGGDDTNEVVTPPASSTSSTSTSAPVTTTTGKAGAPAVTQFTATPSPVTCSGPSAQTTLTWSVAGATNVTIEIDGAPQNTQPFAPVAQTNVPFNCAVAQHNYTLVANGADGQQTRQQIVVGKVTPPTSPPTTKPPATTTTTHPPVTTTSGGGTTTSTSEGTTTSTTKPDVTKVDVAIGDDGTPDGPMTLTVVPDSVDDGKVVFTIDTTGTQLHSFVILKTDTPFDQLPVDPTTHKVSQDDQVGTTIKVKPGKIKHYKIDLVAGNYVLVDNLPGNYDAGARAAFVVIAN